MSTTDLIASVDELVRNPKIQRPHVVILGAGASVASCPKGDKNGRCLPTMDNLVKVLGLESLLSKYGIEYASENFEDLYSSLYSDARQSSLITEIESRVHSYFSSLELPDTPTVYDHLLLSLRKKDAIFTFNWDPFLFDAYARNRHFDLPEIFFLHGNVRVAYCARHIHRWSAPWLKCAECDADLVPTRLLYPIKEKNYSANEFIDSSWENAKWFLTNAFVLTIFGYGAPKSDVVAIEIMKTAWHGGKARVIERVEIIDVKSQDKLYETWSPFIFHHHDDYRKTFYDSYIAHYPRRSCEALYAPTAMGRPAERFSIPQDLGFDDLYEWLAPIAEHDGKLTGGSNSRVGS